MFKSETFKPADLFVFVILEGVGLPICVAAGEALVSGEYWRAAFGWLIGLPLIVGGAMAPFGLGRLSDPLRSTIRDQAIRWWPGAALLAFLYFTGPRIFAAGWWDKFGVWVLALVCGTVAVLVIAHLVLRRLPLPAQAAASAKTNANAQPLPQNLPSSDRQISRDVLHLLDFGVHQTTLVMLSRLVDDIPSLYNVDGTTPFPAELANESSNHSAQAYLQSVRDYVCDGSDRAMRYQNLFLQAARQAERELRETPVSQRPTDIDPLELREYAISFRQAVYTANFLNAEKTTMEELVIRQRDKMIELFRIANK